MYVISRLFSILSIFCSLFGSYLDFFFPHVKVLFCLFNIGRIHWYFVLPPILLGQINHKNALMHAEITFHAYI